MRLTVIITFKDGVAEEHCYRAWELLADYLAGMGVLEDLEDKLPLMSRVWTELLKTENGWKCVGFTTLSQVWDVSNFHCDDDRTRARLMGRLATVIEESQGKPSVALVNVSPAVEKKWIPMLEGMGAKRANRWAVPVGTVLSEGGDDVLRPKPTAKESEQHSLELDSERNSQARQGS